MLVISAGVRVTHNNRVLPGVRVEGVSLGGQTRGEVRRELSALAERASHEPIRLVADGRRLTIEPVEGGYVVDLDKDQAPPTAHEVVGAAA